MSSDTIGDLPGPRAFGLRFLTVQAVLFVGLSVILRWILYRSFAWHLSMDYGSTVAFHALGALGDATVAAWLFLPGVIWLALVPIKWRASRWHTWMIVAAAWMGWTLAIFIFQAEFYFFEEYNSRFNTVAIDYLHYWTEVSANVFEMYPVYRIVALRYRWRRGARRNCIRTGENTDRGSVRKTLGGCRCVVSRGGRPDVGYTFGKLAGPSRARNQ